MTENRIYIIDRQDRKFDTCSVKIKFPHLPEAGCSKHCKALFFLILGLQIFFFKYYGRRREKNNNKNY